jgi:hypothetical protein
MILVGKPEEKRPLGRQRRRWLNNIVMELGEMGWRVDSIGLAHDKDKWKALVTAAMNSLVPQSSAKLEWLYN